MTAVEVGLTIEQAFRAKFKTSGALWERARAVSPSGIHHDVRRVLPFPVYIDHADGCRKWDVDGNELIDLGTGHGSLILGHGHPAIVGAVQAQAARLMHASAPTELEVVWAENVTRMVPCADMVRFVLSGTEATMLAMRLARGYTGRDVIVRFNGHFHGWHDYALIGYMPPFYLPFSNGVPGALAATVRHVPLDNLGALEEALKPMDVAAVILEADGPLGGTVPVKPGFLEGVRELTSASNSLLIFDEVVTGFRMAPGGAQEYYGVTPDLATFAKAMCGGVASGALAGKAAIMSAMTFRDDGDWNRRKRVRHMGTYSANPIAAAAGVAATELLADGSVQDQAARAADRLKAGMNAVLVAAGVRGCVYGTRSTIRAITGDDLPDIHEPAEFTAAVDPLRLLENTRPAVLKAVQAAQLVEGLDIIGGTHAWTSIAMTDSDIDEAVVRFARAIDRVVREGALTSHA